MRRWNACGILLLHLGLLAAALPTGPLRAADPPADVPAEPTPEQAKFFEEQVRPVLATNCYKCHGEEKQKGELRLDSLTAILAGGESGPAVVVGKPEESLLVEAIRHESFEMPPEGKLKDNAIMVAVRCRRNATRLPTKIGPFGPSSLSKTRLSRTLRTMLGRATKWIASSSTVSSANNSGPHQKPRPRCSCGDCTSI
jgi:hypothetical protein